MVAKRKVKGTEKAEAGRPRSARASASLPPDIYATLQGIAREKKVSFAWVIRDAAEKYIAEQSAPLETRAP